MDLQLELDFSTKPQEQTAAPKKKKPAAPKKYVDYEKIYQRLLQGPTTCKEIMQMAGVPKNGVVQVITTLSIRYPLWSPSRGVYKLIEDSDYQ